MQNIEVDYNRNLEPLEKVLSFVKQPGDFFVSGTVEVPMPRVTVAGAGTLSFPIPTAQIKALVGCAERAPYGRGKETVLDTSVRNVWQIAASKVKISGTSWQASFDEILSKVKAGLGCERAKVTAELYKLLVYERGGFFLAHRDTEKSNGMFGTLVITLPSTYIGGALKIRHDGREVTVETDDSGPSALSFTAFYADCEHEALPVREGNRVSLVYNLVQARSKGKGRLVKAPEYETQITKAAAILEQFSSAAEAPPKIAWLLDHQYSPAGLSFSALKGTDAPKARVLQQAAERANCAVHLAVVHIGDSGAAEEEGFYEPRWSRRDAWRDEEDYFDDDDFDDEEDEVYYDENDDGVEFTVASVDEEWRYLDKWRDPGGRAVELGQIPLGAGELLPAGGLDGEPPDERRYMEASGNEGATFERAYHRAVLVIWPESRAWDVRLQSGVVTVLPHLKKLVSRGERARSEAISIAERLVDAWQADAQRARSFFRDEPEPPGASHRIEMIGALVKLKAPAPLARFLGEVVKPSYDGSENEALASTVDVLGDEQAGAVLSTLVSARMAGRPDDCADLLRKLVGNRALSEVAEAAVAALDVIGTRGSRPEVFNWAEEERERPLGRDFVVTLLPALQRFDSAALLESAAAKIASWPGAFPPATIVIPGIEKILKRSRIAAELDTSLRRLWSGAAEYLLGRSEVPPAPPPDWRLDVKIGCSCADCRELQAFARDPVERVHRFRVKQERRSHLQLAILNHRLEITHEIERIGTPQTLVCTKDRRSFHARRKEYEAETGAMRKLVELAPKCGGSALTVRLEDAVKRAAAP